MKKCIRGMAFTVIASTIAQIGYAADNAGVAAADKTTGATGIDEVVVTARRRTEVLRDVPMAVDVATGEQLEKLNLLNFQDLQQLSPGLVLDKESNTASLRGVTYNALTGAQPSVDIYLNEAPVDGFTAFATLYDLEQVEVLRGPQGILRGRTAPSGAITMRTRRPDLQEVTGYAQGTLTDQNGKNIQGAISVPLIKDRLALRIAGVSDSSRGNGAYNVNRGDSSHIMTDSMRVSLAWKPSDAINVVLANQYLHQRSRDYRFVVGNGNRPSTMSPLRSGPPAGPEDRIAVSEGPSLAERTYNLTTLNADWDLGSHTLSFVGFAQTNKQHSVSDNDPANAVPGFVKPADSKMGIHSNSMELRLSSNGEHFLNYTLGAYRARYDAVVNLHQDATSLFSSPLTPFPPSVASLPATAALNIPNLSHDTSVFGSVSLRLTDQLKLDAGVRYTEFHVEKQSTLTVTTPGGVGFLAAVPASTLLPTTNTVAPNAADQRGNATTGGASLTYKWNDDVTSYASYGHSYRRGSAQVGVTVPLDPSLMVTKPEESDAVEVGLKASLFNRKLNLNVAAFVQQYKNYIDVVTVPVASGRNGVIDMNAQLLNYNGDVASKGVEMQATAKPTRNWDIGGAFSWVDSHFDNATVPCTQFNASGVQVVPVGQQVATCQSSRSVSSNGKWSLNTNTEYRWAMGSYQPFVRGLLTYRPGFYSEAVDTRFSSLTNVNLFLGLRDRTAGWTVTLFAKNLFDTTRVVPQSTAANGGGQSGIVQIATRPLGAYTPVPYISGYQTANINPPREIGVTLQYDF